jgi:hypothetical protein
VSSALLVTRPHGTRFKVREHSIIAALMGSVSEATLSGAGVEAGWFHGLAALEGMAEVEELTVSAPATGLAALCVWAQPMSPRAKMAAAVGKEGSKGGSPDEAPNREMARAGRQTDAWLSSGEGPP